jgi:SAM-dependent methyltransferase
VRPASDDARRARSLSFGSVAQSYERYRPGYPEAVVDLLLGRLEPTGRDGRDEPVSALEVGAGTGKATRVVAGRGIAVTALEPDPQMCELLSGAVVGLPVTVVRGTFEEVPEDSSFDLVYAAAAWHWTDPASRYERAARLLRPGGVLACFGGGTDLVDEALAGTVRGLLREVVPSEDVEGADEAEDPDGLDWPGNEIARSRWFTDVTRHPLPQRWSMPADEFVGLLTTVSAYVVLPDAVRGELMARVRASMPDTVDVRRELSVHLARRVS